MIQCLLSMLSITFATNIKPILSSNDKKLLNEAITDCKGYYGNEYCPVKAHKIGERDWQIICGIRK